MTHEVMTHGATSERDALAHLRALTYQLHTLLSMEKDENRSYQRSHMLIRRLRSATRTNEQR